MSATHPSFPYWRLTAWFPIFLIIATNFYSPVKGINYKRATTLSGLVEQYKLPGIAAFDVRSNGTLETGVSGVRKAGNSTAITVEDKFHLGSNSKAMTATLLAIIIENGNGSLTWNSTLPEALPSLSNISAAFQNTTLAMVAAHRSGIAVDLVARNESLLLQLFNPDFDPVLGRRLAAEQFLREGPDLQPNTAFNYSNMNFVILGHIIDQRGETWESAIRTRLWEPLKMDGCGLGPTPQLSPEGVDNPWGHNVSASGALEPVNPYSLAPPADNPKTYAPAGTVHCTPSSWSKFLSLHLSALEGKDTTLLPPSAFDILHQGFPLPEGEIVPEPFTSGGFVAGETEKYGGRYLWHDGTNTMNWAIVVLAPERNISMAVMTNVGGKDGMQACENGIGAWFSGDLKLSVNGTDDKPNGASTLDFGYGISVLLSGLIATLFI